LQELRTVAITGLLHDIGQDEIEWIHQRWPRLISLNVPILRVLNDSGAKEIDGCATFKGKTPAYDLWFP